MTYEELIAKARHYYGDAGLFAVETSCIGPDDLAKGLDHCLERIAPALEEELFNASPQHFLRVILKM